MSSGRVERSQDDTFGAVVFEFGVLSSLEFLLKEGVIVLILSFGGVVLELINNLLFFTFRKDLNFGLLLLGEQHPWVVQYLQGRQPLNWVDFKHSLKESKGGS